MIERDIPIPKYPNTTIGWDYNLVVLSGWMPGDAVYRAWSGSVRHGRGHDPSQSGSQRGRALYSTEALAWRALREAFIAKHNERLSWLDERIKAAAENSE